MALHARSFAKYAVGLFGLNGQVPHISGMTGINAFGCVRVLPFVLGCSGMWL